MGQLRAVGSSLTRTAYLLRDAAEDQGISQSEIARRLGKHSTSVAQLFTSTYSEPHRGLRPHRAGDLPLVYQVAELLAIPADKLGDAMRADEREFLKRIRSGAVSRTSMGYFAQRAVEQAMLDRYAVAQRAHRARRAS